MYFEFFELIDGSCLLADFLDFLIWQQASEQHESASSRKMAKEPSPQLQFGSEVYQSCLDQTARSNVPTLKHSSIFVALRCVMKGPLLLCWGRDSIQEGLKFSLSDTLISTSSLCEVMIFVVSWLQWSTTQNLWCCSHNALGTFHHGVMARFLGRVFDS